MKELRGRRLEQRHLRSGNFATETGTLGLGLVDDRRVRDKVGLGLPLLPEAVHRHLGRKFGIESDKVWIKPEPIERSIFTTNDLHKQALISTIFLH